jgi:hypothetical protein
VNVPPGADIVHFDCQTYPVNATWPQVISAQIGNPSAQGSSQDVTNATLTVLPAVLSSLVVQPGTLTGGDYQSADGVIHGVAQGTVQFSGKVAAARPRLGSGTGTAGVVVTLSSSDPGVNVPNAIEVTGGTDSATFSIMTAPVLQDKTVEIKAASRNLEDVKALHNITKVATLIVRRVLPTNLSLDPPTVNSGSPSTGTVTMSGPAPYSGGMDIQLTSSDPAVATVLPSVHYSFSQTSTTSNPFTIQTHSVQKDTSVNITACSSIPPGCQPASLTVVAPKAQLYVRTVTYQDANGQAIQTPVAGQQFTMCYNVVNGGGAESASNTLNVTMHNSATSSDTSWSESIPAIGPGTGATVCLPSLTLSAGATYDFNGYIGSAFAGTVTLPF